MDSVKEIIRLDNIWVYHNGSPALEAIDLSVEQHDFLGIIGPNGGGKTTLLKVILGLISPNSGKVSIMGLPPNKGRRFIGYVAQSNPFDSHFPISVFDVVLMGRFNHIGLIRHYSKEDRSIAAESLKTVGMLDYKDRQIGSLSGGEQQRVFIARALTTNPKLLILDEPMASVDPSMQADFYELMKSLKQRMAIVMVSHDVSAVSIHVDKIACLNRKLFYHGSKEVSAEALEETYQCPIQLIAHGPIPHRVLKEH